MGVVRPCLGHTARLNEADSFVDKKLLLRIDTPTLPSWTLNLELDKLKDLCCIHSKMM